MPTDFPPTDPGPDPPNDGLAPVLIIFMVCFIGVIILGNCEAHLQWESHRATSSTSESSSSSR
jgi:hypothetical protein